ncbi:glycosyltransferase family 2 protein [Candidatus Roizmanbacteria bacterium]|nr:glycosyltransferase family 2 protein [Candidatus Roizmanbacteria bacterium]
MKLSLCIATFNEEQNIHYPLDSAYDLVDEVVIVDGGSTDKTVEKAKSYGRKVRIFIEDNPPMFHINKQKAIERAKGEWILQLDADEGLSDELKKEIENIVMLSGAKHLSRMRENNSNKLRDSSASPQNDKEVAYYLPRKNFFLTRFLMKGGQYPDYTIRLYRNGYVRFPCKDVHENVEIISQKLKVKSQKFKNQEGVRTSEVEEDSDVTSEDGKTSEVNLKIGYLKNPILHYADPDFSRYLQRWDRYTTLEAEQLAKKFHPPTSIFHLLLMFIDYFIIKPSLWFILTYIRHLGFLDGFPGFVFALFSSIRFWAIYVKFWQLQINNNKFIPS